MDIRNRMADVSKLRCNVCQDFLKLIIAPNWRRYIYNRAKDEVENDRKYKNSYIAAFEKMRNVGVDSYDVDDMDVSFIFVVIQYCRSVAPTTDQTKKALQKLVDDRNAMGHSDENEDPEELYLRGLLSLLSMRDFVRTVDKFEQGIDDAARLQYRLKYMADIERLKDLLDEERIELVQWKKEVNRDINKILKSDDTLKTYIEISEIYKKRFQQYHTWDSDPNKYEEFEICASDAGIVHAHTAAAIIFHFMRNYSEVEKRLIMLYQSYEKLPRYEVHFIVERINDLLLANGSISDKMEELLEGIRSQGYEIELNEKGYYQETLIRAKEN